MRFNVILATILGLALALCGCTVERRTETRYLPARPAADVLRGTIDGGGGSVVVCRDRRGRIKSVRLLDLVEGTKIHRLTEAPPQGTLEDEWRFFAGRFAHRFQIQHDGDYAGLKTLADIKKYIETPRKTSYPSVELPELQNTLAFKDLYFKKWRPVGDDIKLKRIDDSHEVFKVKGCETEQIANYQDLNTILIQESYWKRLSPRDQAALIAHEFLYKKYRDLGHTNSVFARRAIAYFFSDREIRPFFADTSPYTISCATPQELKQDLDYFPLIADLKIDYVPSGLVQALGQGRLHFARHPRQYLVGPTSAVDAGNSLGLSQAIGAIETCFRIGGDFVETNSYDLNYELDAFHFRESLKLKYEVRCGTKRKAPDYPNRIEFDLTVDFGGGTTQVFNCPQDTTYMPALEKIYEKPPQRQPEVKSD